MSDFISYVSLSRFNGKIEKERASSELYLTQMKNPDNVLEVDNLCVSFFTGAGIVKAVDGISFEIPKNSTVALVGESGCGKTVTALSLMQLLSRPSGKITGGEIRFNNGDGSAYNIVKAPSSVMEGIRGKSMSMIFQEPMTSLNPVYSIGKQIDEATVLHNPGMRRKEVKARTMELLDMVGLAGTEGVYGMYPHELSGGMIQRVMTAIAIACTPSLIIADEPTTALDVTVQAQILDLMKNLRKKLGSSIMLITHDLGVVAEMADYVVVMYAGRVVEKGTADDIFHHPSHPYTIALMKSRPVAGKKNDRLFSIPGTVPDPLNMPSGCYFCDRCAVKEKVCKDSYPPSICLSDTHTVSCCRFHDEKKIIGYPKTVKTEDL